MAQPILFLEILLVAAGIIFLVLECKAPGHFVSGAIALLCFAGFFLIHFLTGGVLILVAISLFAIGVTLLGVELFLTGDGIAGVCGAFLILAGLVIGGIDNLPETVADWADVMQKLLRHVLTAAVAVIVAFQIAKYLPDIPFLSRLLLVPPEDNLEEETIQPSSADEALLGQIGAATSLLRPSGSAQFGDRRVDVTTEWDFIEPGTPIQIVAVEGTHIVVRKV